MGREGFGCISLPGPGLRQHSTGLYRRSSNTGGRSHCCCGGGRGPEHCGRGRRGSKRLCVTAALRLGPVARLGGRRGGPPGTGTAGPPSSLPPNPTATVCNRTGFLFCLRNKDDRGFPASQACSATVLLPQCARGDGEGRRGHSLRGYLLKKKNT